ncbi:hypothetical protein PV326_005186 [Microctonus aethiopoides]|nr:hypothetical protein PV326_005186 [Microctonus aethiopoides]
MRHVAITNSIFICLLIIHLIFLAVTKAQNLLYDNVTDEKLMNTERLKRSPTDEVPKIIKAVIIEHGKPIIRLRWVKTDQLLANKNLPVWGAKSANIYEEKKQASDILDSFVMYQDVEQTSAIIYVKDKQVIFGFVDVIYYIHDRRIENWDETIFFYVGEHCLKKNSEANVHGEHNRPHFSLINSASKNFKSLTLNENSSKESNEVNNQPSGSQTEKKKYYLETLLYVTYDIIESIKIKYPDDNYLFRMLLDYAAYFNAVDMMLAKLPTKFRVYFNLAGIIFEEDKDVFSSRTGAQTLSYDEKNNNLVLENFFVEFTTYYTSDPNFIFPLDSYDYIFFSTTRDLEFEDEVLPGLTIVGEDIYHMKYINDHDMQRHSFTAVQKSSYFSFPVAAHEVGHVLGCTEHDSLSQGKYINKKQCSSIMQESLPVCYNCLNWSSRAVKQIEEYMHKERNRCWLLNFPRSLHKPNEPRVYLLPSEQCKCFGYNSHGKESNEYKEYIPSKNCAKPLRCLKIKKHNYINVPTILPFDGVPCAEGYQQVCWKGQCINAQSN